MTSTREVSGDVSRRRRAETATVLNTGASRTTPVVAAALSWNVTINGLPIENERSLDASNLVAGQMAQYYKDEVIGGPDAFIVVAKSFADIERAISRKLLREIAGDEGGAKASASSR